MAKDSFLHALHILLAETTIGSVLDGISSPFASPKHLPLRDKKSSEFKRNFCRKCVQCFPWFSLSDAEEIYRVAFLENDDKEPCHGVFSFMRSIAQEYLYEKGAGLVCHYNKILAWRQASRDIGQSPFICAYWAWKDHHNTTAFPRTCSFAPFVKTDNLRLQQILAKGMAENHFHLKGSGPIFLLSWVCLMNNIENRKIDFDNELLKYPIFKGDDQFTLHQRVIIAAYIRYYLWSKYVRDTLRPKIKATLLDNLEDNGLQELLKNIRRPQRFAVSIQRKISIQRLRHGLQRLDYAGSHRYMVTPYGPIGGEHSFLYRILRVLFANGLSDIEKQLFYAYLIVYVQLRRELVQVNNVVGFSNFALYQDRKDVFLKRFGEYSDALIRMAHASVLSNPAVRCLEARVTPKNNCDQLAKAHKALEQLAVQGNSAVCRGKREEGAPIFHKPLTMINGKCFFFDEKKNTCRRRQGPCRLPLSRVSYVQHFVKKPDLEINWEDPVEKLKARRQCRHFMYRRQAVEAPATALEQWRSSGARQAARVHGIDACNFEIGCRPEVFAPSFRRLRSHTPPPLYGNLYSWTLPTLRITYHVGEDFLDIVDGLRAIDEALRFFELGYGDRLGHALALGVDAANWYSFKKEKVFLPKQDLLDNIAWFYCRLLRLDLCNIELEHRLEDAYTDLYSEIFGGQPAPISVYFDAWKLRGNHPKLFLIKNGNTNQSPKYILARFSHEIQPPASVYRMAASDKVYDLVHRYHYDPQVREIGNTSIEYDICPLYIQAVSSMQKAMRAYIASKGIGIETNPSSNFLIGTYKDYQRSPLLSFYDLGLREHPESELLFVSINTDDQGIFDTTIENEYALVACAMESVKDANGKSVYPPERVYRWIDNIRTMGLEQSFKLTDRNIGGNDE